ncbi:MAG: polyisoprenoid-binding protein YceI [Myxococcota bacterium]|jgi:polyisoprenoid-binding protein YceI
MKMALLGLLLTSGCIEDVGKDKVEAVVEEVAPEPAPAKPPPGQTRTLKVDATKSKLQALGAKVTATHPIVFKSFSGDVTLKGDDVVGISFTTKTADLEADHPKLTKHLLEEDFLFVSAHPEATFVSTGVKAGSAEPGMTHTVQGTLTIRGQSKKITFPAKVEVSGDAVKASTEFVINRQDFGVTYPGRADDLVQDNVVLTISFVTG